MLKMIISRSTPSINQNVQRTIIPTVHQNVAPIINQNQHLRGEREKTTKSDKPLNPNDEEKAKVNPPGKFLNEQHEQEWELREQKKKIIMKVSREDFIAEYEDYNDDILMNTSSRMLPIMVKYWLV